MSHVLVPIPLNVPSPAGAEADYVADAMRFGYLAGDGGYTACCHGLLESSLAAGKALLTTSCTHALEMSAILLNIRAGDEVIVPSFTYVTVANAFVLRGAKPVFADVRLDTLNVDETRLEALITPRTKAIVVVHYAGIACEMDVILEIARRRGVPVVEDTAHGIFGRYRDRWLGTMGAMGTLSFHETKNFTCGEGGALLVNDPSLVDRAEIVREKGTNRSRFLRGDVDRYTWVDVGSSYLPSELLAAFLLAQLEARDRVQTERARVWNYYAAHLQEWAGRRGVRLPFVPAECSQAFHLFYLIMPSQDDRRALMTRLTGAGITSATHYQPLHLSEMGHRFGGRPGDCPVSEQVSERILRLPFYRTLTDTDLERIVATVTGW
jgi:dTDP-4-amino-4,6-dideoxygalactose transaminase